MERLHAEVGPDAQLILLAQVLRKLTRLSKIGSDLREVLLRVRLQPVEGARAQERTRG